MAVYKFRVYIEEDHEVFRDIEVKGKQRFADFHQSLVQSFSFKQNQPAQYISSDQSWWEGDTVVELDENLKGDHQKIVRHISEPHQRFLCHTESFKDVWLALELKKILPEEEGVSYPRCVKSEGKPPFYTQPPPKPIVDEPEESVDTAPEAGAMFDGDGPSEEEIERFQKEAAAAGKAGELKAPKVDVQQLTKKSEKKKEEGFDDFDVDDLM